MAKDLKNLPSLFGFLRKSCTLPRHPIEANVSGIANKRELNGLIIKLINESEVTACETERPPEP